MDGHKRGTDRAVMWRQGKGGNETGEQEDVPGNVASVCLDPCEKMGKEHAEHAAMYHPLIRLGNMEEGIGASPPSALTV